jgi:hypothetical protein
MVTSAQLAGVVVSSVVLIAVPGPSVMFIVGRALALGRQPALAAVRRAAPRLDRDADADALGRAGPDRDRHGLDLGLHRRRGPGLVRPLAPGLRRTEQVGGSCIIALGVATALIPEKS